VQRSDPVTELQALTAFARLYGYVRFFHPTDRAAHTDWQRFAAQGAAHVRSSTTVGDLTDRLQQLFDPLAPKITWWVGNEPVPPPRTAPRAKDGHIYWQYQGYVGTPVSLYRPPYERARVGADRDRRRFTESPPADATIEAALAGAIHVRIPVVLSEAEAAAQGSEPVLLDPEVGALAHDRDGYRSLDVRQGAVVEVWNVLRHFYPYQQEVQLDWDSVLERALLDAVDDEDRQDMVATLGRMLHALDDGHGEAGHTRLHHRALPIRVELIEGEAVITATDDERFEVGDVVVAFDGEPMQSRLERIEQTLSGSPQWRRYKATAWMSTLGRRGNTAEVKIRRDGEVRVVEARYDRPEPLPAPRHAPFRRYEDGVVYVDLTRIDSDELRSIVPELAQAPGVVFDMRGYPDNTHFIIDHLLPQAEDALWLNVPKILGPDGTVAGWHQIGWHRRPAEPRIEGRTAFLVSPEAISYAESILGYVEAHRLGTLIGSPSAGANGDIVRLDTLAGFYVIFSGMRVTRHDGSPFHRVGIEPDLPVLRTLAGVRDGRDEVLEAALEHVRDVPAHQLANTGAGRAAPPRAGP
jgi:hypothetical protein